jgi:hypothetical protein
MEKSNIVKILPKKKPWELQKYALSSFKFQDVDKNMTVLATDEQIKQAENLLNSAQTQLQKDDSRKLGSVKVRIYTFILALIVVGSYIMMIWDVMQPAISPVIFVSAFSIAIAGSIVLGMMLSRFSLRANHDVR